MCPGFCSQIPNYPVRRPPPATHKQFHSSNPKAYTLESVGQHDHLMIAHFHTRSSLIAHGANPKLPTQPRPWHASTSDIRNGDNSHQTLNKGFAKLYSQCVHGTAGSWVQINLYSSTDPPSHAFPMSSYLFHDTVQRPEASARMRSSPSEWLMQNCSADKITRIGRTSSQGGPTM